VCHLAPGISIVAFPPILSPSFEDIAEINPRHILSSNSSLSVGIDILDKGELSKATDFLLIVGVALAGKKLGLECKSVPLRVVEGMISFAAIARLPDNGARKYLDTHKCRGSLKSLMGSITQIL
jgi:hypothetical protein